MFFKLKLICLAGGKEFGVRLENGYVVLNYVAYPDAGWGIFPFIERLDPTDPFLPFSDTPSSHSTEEFLFYAFPPVKLGDPFGHYIPFWMVALICLIPACIIYIHESVRRRQDRTDPREPEATDTP